MYQSDNVPYQGLVSALISFSTRVQAYFDLGGPISGTRRLANCSRQWTDSVIISLVGPTSDQQGLSNRGPTVDSRLGSCSLIILNIFPKLYLKKLLLFNQMVKWRG